MKWLKRLLCLILNHKVNPGDYIDHHGEDDNLTFCERCGKYDV